MNLTPIPSTIDWAHGECASWLVPASEAWACGWSDGALVVITEDGRAWAVPSDCINPQRRGFLPVPEARSLGVLVPPERMPPIPDSEDAGPWDAWAAAVRAQVPQPVQQSLFDEGVL